jgi:hypothetical protein
MRRVKDVVLLIGCFFISLLTCKGQIPNEKEVYALINDLPYTFTSDPQIDLHPLSLDIVKSRDIFKRLLIKRSVNLLFPEVSKKLNSQRDSIKNLNLSKEVKDSLLFTVNSVYPRKLTDLFSQTDRKKMESEILLKKIKWRKRKANMINFSKRKSKTRISFPLFNQQKNLALFFRTYNGEYELVVFKLTDSIWQGYGRARVVPVNLN